jgi:hypothetical protein
VAGSRGRVVRVAQSASNMLSGSETVSFSGKNLLHAVSWLVVL